MNTELSDGTSGFVFHDMRTFGVRDNMKTERPPLREPRINVPIPTNDRNSIAFTQETGLDEWRPTTASFSARDTTG